MVVTTGALRPATPPARFATLDSLRGISALLVCLFHFRVNSPIYFSSFVHESWLFVDFFFVLSGFVMSLTYRDKLIAGFGLKAFIGLRFFRLYPLHLFILLAMLAFELVGKFLLPGAMAREPFSGYYSVDALWLNLFLLHSFGIIEGLSWNAPSWSIATEFWTYVLFALLLQTAREKSELFLVAAVPFCILFLLLVSPTGIDVTWNFGMVRCILGFSLGALCFWAWRRWSKALPDFSTAQWTLVEALAITLVIAAILALANSRANLLLPFVFTIAIFVFAREGGAISTALKARPLLFLGTLSYSIYMVHILVQSRFEDLIRLLGIARFEAVMLSSLDDKVLKASGNPLDGTLLTFAMLALVILTAYLTWRLIEKPGIALGKSQFGNTPLPAAG